ncbi:hypothetical protein HPB48_007304 [Haemaphysalis longicornis]|uniref:Endonuclease/exonuclease/phosphatase domain-containing protein n=1 Tax=Haemaphysalis longicornis TaxID=44386 RepID=A0A9J6GWT2_HAELO|nr:hypothetical protein HPB48_007304 [Haemaphysalis longicornis]
MTHTMTYNHSTILQWNCRSFSTAKTIIAAKVKNIKPIALLLQETLTTPPLPGYNVFINSSIPRNSQVLGHAAILLDTSVLATQLCLSLSSSPLYGVVAIIAYPPRVKKLILVSAYYRPRYQTCSDAFSWLQHIRNEYPSTPILIEGDFNAPHTTWGYPTNSDSAKYLLDSTEVANVHLNNDTTYFTRIALHPNHTDTTPDLTWASPCLVKTWALYSTTWGNDHLPILITLRLLAFI